MKPSAPGRLIPLLAFLALTPLLCLAADVLSFAVVPNVFPAQPDNQLLGPTHGGIVIDKAGNIYMSTDTPRGIVVFAPDGKFVRAFGPTRIHAMQLRAEGGTEFIYAARASEHEVTKLKLDGTVEWTMAWPEESGIYTKATEFNPTNIVAAPDGSIFVADGYGKKFIHKYDKNRKYVKSFGGPGTTTPAEDGKFNTCHGLAMDTRGPMPLLFVCNRESGRVEHWDLDGNLVKVLQRDLRMPAGADVRGDYAAIAELKGRVTVLGKDNQIVAKVGDNPNDKQWANFGLVTDQWTDGMCNSPHAVALDKAGNLIVAEWSKFGRVIKFARAR